MTTTTVPNRPEGRLRRFWRHNGAGYLFVAPSLIFFSVFIFFPLAWSFLLSFQDFRFRGSEWIGLDNYLSVLANPIFHQSVLNTVIYSVSTVGVWVFVAMVLATLIHPLPGRMRTFFRAAYYLPAVTSAVFIALVWKWMLNANPWGVFNYFIGLVGIEPLGWVSDPSPFLGSSVALWSVILSSVLTIPAVGVVLYSAALANIPRELYEAAESEGAGAWQKFRFITIPLLKPVTLYVAIIYTIAAFEVFERVYVMTGGGPGYATHTIVYLIWRTAFRFTDYGAASAQAFLLFIVIATISLIQFRALRGEVEY
ncbi:MAG: carbohydrate ABC transporter permease [Candidatus Limnocylindria bacterium]